MATPQLDGVSGSSSLTNFNSTTNKVLTDNSNATANLFFISLPFLSPDTTSTSLSFLGKQRVINITGKYLGANDAAMQTFISEIETEVMSPNQAIRQYTNAFGQTYNVKINVFNYTADINEPNVMNYSMELFVES